MSSVSGNPGNLRELARKLKALPVTVAQRIATRTAPSLSGLARASFLAGQTVYGDARPEGVNGPVSLYRSGAMLGTLSFVAIGRIVRASLGTRYARFHIGRFRILPQGNMPTKWREQIGQDARTEISGGLR